MTGVSAAVRAQLAALDAAHCRLARTDANAFMTYVLRDEETGVPLALNADQREWQTLTEKHRRLLVWSSIESGKTTLLSIGRTLFEIGRAPSTRIAIVSNTDAQAQKLCLAIQKYVEDSAPLRRVFPKLARAKNLPWNAHQLYVARATPAKDPSVQTCGIHGNILGARLDLIILDDLLDYENTLSPTQRVELRRWYYATLEGRLTRDGRVICAGTAWHREDIMHHFARSPGWHARRYPIVDAATGLSRWPERWPAARIAQKKIDLDSAVEFSRQMLCVARSDEDARFKGEWIDRCLRRGLGVAPTYGLEAVPDGYRTFTGVDLGVGQKRTSDRTSMVTLILHPDGTREVLEVASGRWAGPEIVARIVDVHHRYQSVVFVESNAAQAFIVQFTKAGSAVPVETFHTGANKLHPVYGIEGMATEMAGGKWVIPATQDAAGALRGATPEIVAWLAELLDYDPAAHAGDSLMASWIAREAARKVKPKVQFGRLALGR